MSEGGFLQDVDAAGGAEADDVGQVDLGVAVEDPLALIENWGRAVLAQLTRPTTA